jgi:hypothetical protein
VARRPRSRTTASKTVTGFGISETISPGDRGFANDAISMNCT